MKATFLFTAAAILLFSSIGCHRKAYPRKSDSNLIGVTGTLTDSQLVQGEAIFRRSCRKCHRLHEPGEHDLAKWNRVLPSMVKKAKLDEMASAEVVGWIRSKVKS